MQIEFDERLKEIQLCFRNDDLNRASQRILDLTYDYDFAPDLRESAIRFRKAYNEGKELGKNQNNNQNLRQDCEEILKHLADGAESQETKGSLLMEPLAYVKGIGKHFTSRLHNFHFKPISLELVPGNIIGLVGENGNGKTTLLRMICGDLATDEGEIEYIFNNRRSTDWQFIKKKIAFIPQRLERWFGTAEDKISFEAAIKNYGGDLNKEKVEFIIHRMGLTNFRELTWSQLSSGYKLRFEIAMALVWDPEVLILDEPLANLDLQAQEILLQDLRNLADSRRNPVSIILSSQQLHEVETIADQIIFLKNGNAVFNGKLEDFEKLEENRTFELNGNFSYNDLQELLQNWEDLKIERSASAFVLSCSSKHSREDLLRLLIENSYEIDYFRNISGSTKKLFSDKY